MNIFEAMLDGIIMVVRAEKTARDVLQHALASLNTEKLVGIVLNDAKLSIPGNYGYGDTKASAIVPRLVGKKRIDKES
jgi:Mrp family chromosome partitioning ATPase